MKKLYLIIISLIILNGCNKPQSVLICGDHVCVNKAEAEQYFEENLSLEVRLLDKKNMKKKTLIELNLLSNKNDKKEISVTKKEDNKKLKVLTNSQIKKKKLEVKKIKEIKRKEQKKEKVVKIKKIKVKKKNEIKQVEIRNDTYISNSEITDICTIINKCSIAEISKYLIKQNKKKDYPNITIRE